MRRKTSPIPRGLYVLSLLVAAPALGLGCDAQVDGDYPGEPLATIHGVVTSKLKFVPEVRASLLWYKAAMVDDAVYSIPMRVDEAFPARFAMNLYGPPPDEVMNILPSIEWNLALAHILILPADFPPGDGSLASVWDAALGVSSDNMVLYTATPIHGDSLTGRRFGGVDYAPGYHLLSVDIFTPEERDALIQCVLKAILEPGDEIAQAKKDRLAACQIDPNDCGNCIGDENGYTDCYVPFINAWGPCSEPYDLLEPVKQGLRFEVPIVLGGEKVFPDQLF